MNVDMPCIDLLHNTFELVFPRGARILTKKQRTLPESIGSMHLKSGNKSEAARTLQRLSLKKGFDFIKKNTSTGATAHLFNGHDSFINVCFQERRTALRWRARQARVFSSRPE